MIVVWLVLVQFVGINLSWGRIALTLCRLNYSLPSVKVTNIVDCPLVTFFFHVIFLHILEMILFNILVLFLLFNQLVEFISEGYVLVILHLLLLFLFKGVVFLYVFISFGVLLEFFCLRLIWWDLYLILFELFL